MHQIQIFPGSVLDPTGGTYSTPQTTSWWAGAGGSLPPPQEPLPCSRARRPLPFGPRTRHIHILFHGADYALKFFSALPHEKC